MLRLTARAALNVAVTRMNVLHASCYVVPSIHFHHSGLRIRKCSFAACVNMNVEKREAAPAILPAVDLHRATPSWVRHHRWIKAAGPYNRCTVQMCDGVQIE